MLKTLHYRCFVHSPCDRSDPRAARSVNRCEQNQNPEQVKAAETGLSSRYHRQPHQLSIQSILLFRCAERDSWPKNVNSVTLFPPPDTDGKSGQVSQSVQHSWSFMAEQRCSILLNTWISWHNSSLCKSLWSSKNVLRTTKLHLIFHQKLQWIL